jgi:hypothetical protein
MAACSFFVARTLELGYAGIFDMVTLRLKHPYVIEPLWNR